MARRLHAHVAVLEALKDLAPRFRHARRAALRSLLPEADGTESDDDLLAQALARDPVGAGKAVFDNSLKLGTAFARFYDKEFTLGELPEVLDALGVPCLGGVWRPAEGEPARILERAGCAGGALGPATCDWWREAIDGLVLGITGGIMHARHESVGHGDARCVDVVYVRPESPMRFGPIPPELRETLDRVCRLARVFDSTVQVNFLGISEGTLSYQAKKSGCGGGIAVSALVEREVHRRFPELALMDVSPRSVLAEGGEAAG